MEPTIYLFFNGTGLEAMRHDARTLGSEISGVVRNAETRRMRKAACPAPIIS